MLYVINRSLASALLVFLCTACSPKPEMLTLQPVWHGKPVNFCEPMANGWQVENLQFFLSDWQLDGQPLLLAADGRNATDSSVLLGGDCQQHRWQVPVQGRLPSGRLSFSLSVPEDVNHLNPLTQPSPINLPDMFWSWQQGHKFLRLDLVSPQGGWFFHLGSVGCVGPSAMRAPSSPCAVANRFWFSVNYQQGQQLTLDLAELLADVALTAGQGCMADPDDKQCVLPLANVQKPALFGVAP